MIKQKQINQLSLSNVLIDAYVDACLIRLQVVTSHLQNKS